MIESKINQLLEMCQKALKGGGARKINERHEKGLLTARERIEQLVGAAGVSAVPDSARVVHTVGLQEDPTNFLLMHAMAPNVAGVIGSAIGAEVLWTVLVL